MIALVVKLGSSLINRYVRPAVLNLFRFADHLTTFVSVCGPPNKFPHFLWEISDDISSKNVVSVRAPHKKFNIFPGKILTSFSQIPCIFQGQAQKKLQIPFAV